MDHQFECPRCKSAQMSPLTRCVECDTMLCDTCMPFGFATVCVECVPRRSRSSSATISTDGLLILPDQSGFI